VVKLYPPKRDLIRSLHREQDLAHQVQVSFHPAPQLCRPGQRVRRFVVGQADSLEGRIRRVVGGHEHVYQPRRQAARPRGRSTRTMNRPFCPDCTCAPSKSPPGEMASHAFPASSLSCTITSNPCRPSVRRRAGRGGLGQGLQVRARYGPSASRGE
jgi:hypothetical protein